MIPSSAMTAAVAAIVAEDEYESGKSSAGTAATAASVAEDNLASGIGFAMTAADKLIGKDTPAVVAVDEAKSVD